MTTYSKNALHLIQAFNPGSGEFEDIDAFTATINFSVPDDVTTLPYVTASITLEQLYVIFSTVAGATISSSDGTIGELDVDEAFFTSVTADIGTFTVLGLGADLSGGNRVLVASSFGGVEIPTINSLAAYNAFESTFGLQTSTLAHDPGPGDSISLTTIPNIVITQNDVLRYTTSNEWVNVGLGNDRIDGDGGVDMLSFVSMTGGMNIDIDGGTAAGGGVAHSFMNFEGVTGSIFGDYIVGDAGDNRIRGLGDYDWFVGSEGQDDYDGGTGRDMISYANNSSTNVYIDLGNGVSVYGTGGDTYTSIERATGSTRGDYFYGSDGEDDFRGLGGYDTFYGSGGGKDRYDGGSGLDTISYLFEAPGVGATEGVIASLLLGRGSAGNAARDLYTSIENLVGTSLADVLTGDNDRNQLNGWLGEDILIGNGGVDRLTGAFGDDTLDGGSGWDYAIYENNQADYSWSTVGGVTMVTHNSSSVFTDGTDTLTNIEVLSFADGDVIL